MRTSVPIGTCLLLVLLFAAVEAAAQTCSQTYHGENHSQAWRYLTIDARSQGVPWDNGIRIHDDPTWVCGHDGTIAADGFYCGEPDSHHEWQQVPCTGEPNPEPEPTPSLPAAGAVILALLCAAGSMKHHRRHTIWTLALLALLAAPAAASSTLHCEEWPHWEKVLRRHHQQPMSGPRWRGSAAMVRRRLGDGSEH